MSMQNIGSPSSKKIIQEKISLFSILSCLLCSMKARVAHICPNCSKFYCFECITKWIKKEKQQCPNCSNRLNQSMLVNCNKLSQNLSNALQTLINLQAPHLKQCQNHKIPQNYYCKDCQISLCSDCIVLEQLHQKHKIIKQQKIKMQLNQKILEKISKIRKHIKQIQQQKQKLGSKTKNKFELNALKDKLQYFNFYKERIKEQYEIQSNNLQVKFQGILRNQRNVILALDEIYQSYYDKLARFSKIGLVRYDCESFFQVLQESIVKSCSQGDMYLIKENKIYLDSLIKTQYTQKIFLLNNYTQFKDKQQVIYSDAFFDGSLQWRLKIYPHGICNSASNNSESKKQMKQSQQYISIYLELVKGVRRGRYQFTIQIINQLDQSKIISQVYEADFDDGKCWGYDQFASISTLYQKGYINPSQDSIKICVKVGNPSFYYSILDKEAQISKKQQIVNKKKQKIQKLKILAQKRSQKYKLLNISNEMEKIQSQSSNKRVQKLMENEEQKKIITPTINKRKQLKFQQLQNSANESNHEDIYGIGSRGNQPQPLSYENYMIVMPKQQICENEEQADHQSAELRKIFRRINQIPERSSLLLF